MAHMQAVGAVQTAGVPVVPTGPVSLTARPEKVSPAKEVRKRRFPPRQYWSRYDIFEAHGDQLCVTW